MSSNIESFGRGPDLVLLHGWGMHSGIWHEVAHELANHFRVHLVDLPGHGKSDDCALTGELVQALAEQLPKPLGVAGWSLGATIALKWALSRPAQVCALALVAATPSFAAREDWPWGWSREALASFERDLQRDPAVALKRFLSLQVKGESEGRSNLRTLRQFMLEAPPPSSAGLTWGLGILKETDLRNALAGIRQPAMLIHGDCDSVVPVAAGSFLAEHLPNARLRIFSGCGHVPFLSRHEQFAAELVEFFNGSQLPG